MAAARTPPQSPAPSDPAMAPMVLLRHTLPDGTWHYDWLLARSAPPADPGTVEPAGAAGMLLSFRIGHRPDDPAVHTIAADHLGDHRVAYLTFEGDVSGGRGRVDRVASGWCRVIQENPEHVEFLACFDGVERRWRGKPRGQPPHWLLSTE